MKDYRPKRPMLHDLIEGRTFGGIAGSRFVNEPLDATELANYGCTLAGITNITDDAIADCAICTED